MTLYQFNRLEEMEQLETIWDNAVEIAEREDDLNRYKLYQINAFYVEEVWYKTYNVRRAFNSFASTNVTKLQPYLDKIDVKESRSYNINRG